MTLYDFLNSPYGTVFLGVISSLLGVLFSKIIRFIVIKFKISIKREYLKRYLIRSGKEYLYGYYAAHAELNSPFHQMLLVGDCLISLIVSISKLFAVAILAVVLLLLFQDLIIARSIVIIISCITITIIFQQARFILRSYNWMFDKIYGEDFKKQMKDNLFNFWLKETKVKNPDTTKASR